jgi:hypothetical protein
MRVLRHILLKNKLLKRRTGKQIDYTIPNIIVVSVICLLPASMLYWKT